MDTVGVAKGNSIGRFVGVGVTSCRGVFIGLLVKGIDGIGGFVDGEPFVGVAVDLGRGKSGTGTSVGALDDSAATIA